MRLGSTSNTFSTEQKSSVESPCLSRDAIRVSWKIWVTVEYKSASQARDPSGVWKPGCSTTCRMWVVSIWTSSVHQGKIFIRRDTSRWCGRRTWIGRLTVGFTFGERRALARAGSRSDRGKGKHSRWARYLTWIRKTCLTKKGYRRLTWSRIPGRNLSPHFTMELWMAIMIWIRLMTGCYIWFYSTKPSWSVLLYGILLITKWVILTRTVQLGTGNMSFVTPRWANATATGPVVQPFKGTEQIWKEYRAWGRYLGIEGSHLFSMNLTQFQWMCEYFFPLN